MSPRVFLLLCGASVIACSSTTNSRGYDEPDAAPPAGLDAGAGRADAGGGADSESGTGNGPVFGGTEAGVTTGQCERTLAVGALSISNAACFVNQHVENVTTKLEFPCAGGVAKATFGGHTFTGTVSGDTIELQDVEPFLFNGCDWQSTETIQGDLANGTVTYSYTEKPVVSCPDTPCTASGSLQVTAGAVTPVK
jgi:hypothetical protein